VASVITKADVDAFFFNGPLVYLLGPPPPVTATGKKRQLPGRLELIWGRGGGVGEPSGVQATTDERYLPRHSRIGVYFVNVSLLRRGSTRRPRPWFPTRTPSHARRLAFDTYGRSLMLSSERACPFSRPPVMCPSSGSVPYSASLYAVQWMRQQRTSSYRVPAVTVRSWRNGPAFTAAPRDPRTDREPAPACCPFDAVAKALLTGDLLRSGPNAAEGNFLSTNSRNSKKQGRRRKTGLGVARTRRALFALDVAGADPAVPFFPLLLWMGVEAGRFL